MRFLPYRGPDRRRNATRRPADRSVLTNVLAAERAGLPVRVLVDRHAARFRELTSTLGISNDDFIRTATDPRHAAGVRRLWEECARRGDVYRRAYRGRYCVRCEQAALSEADLEFWRRQRDPDSSESLSQHPELFWCEGYFVAVGRVPDRRA